MAENNFKSSNEDSLLRHIDISVLESEKRTNGTLNLRDYYMVYLLEVRVTDPKFFNELTNLSMVWRRYTEFEQLYNYLKVTYPYIVTPPLPEKRVLYGWQKASNDSFDPDFIDRRRAGLETFLLRISSHYILSWDKQFLQFLQDESWREAYKTNGYLQVVENKLKGLSVSVRLKNPDSRFLTLKHYSSTLHINLNNVLRARSRVAEKQYNIHKLHANYGRVFSEWSANEKEMGDGLQRMGHYLDSLASSIDAVLEDEELLADQLKEYLFFSESLQNVCKNQEMLQLQLEDAETTVASKTHEKSKAQQGKLGMMSKLFGAVDTEEVRELKINLLDQQIHDGSEVVGSSKNELSDFCTNALDDVERFQSQKVVDLTETLAAYAVLQLKTAKKNLQTWFQIRDCLQHIP
ncbi:hypothetical protein RN001_005241 [Aquatica leii]|uniref:PX domain-containing protein n=1 Tax=Aquatica leii TaxID=1421715 RepID=A0AAN7PBN8_9COLE|nr:hypothetical protein RN001_005241 [Aquatica leii]